jgi:clan AA aspartic protease
LDNHVAMVSGVGQMKLGSMGIAYAEIELVNREDIALLRRGYIQEDQIRRTTVRALVDSGTSLLTISESLRNQLDLPTIDRQQAELEDGSVIDVEVVGPVEVRFQNRIAISSAMVVPGEAEVLLGAIPMQAMDVLIDPKLERLIVNPKSPDRARMLLK